MFKKKNYRCIRRCAPSAALAVVLFTLIILFGALSVTGRMNPTLEDDAAEEIAEALNDLREDADLPGFVEHSGLRARAEDAAIALARSIQSDPKKFSLPDQMSAENLRKDLSDVAQLVLQADRAEDLERLIRRTKKWKLLTLKDMSHLGVGVCRVELGGKRELLIVAAIAGRILPEMDGDLLNEGQREFRFECHLCGHKFNGKMAKPVKENMGSLQLQCPKCGLVFDLYGLDEKNRYHRPPWFIKGFKPAEIKNPLVAWLFVLKQVRYVRDAEQFGRKDVWQIGRQTFRRRRGDCEDTSILLGDWLISTGYEARVALGQVKKSGHAWVVLHHAGHDYVLETTGLVRAHRRVPPRAELLPMYMPRVNFDGDGVWFRRATEWTAAYFDEAEWAQGPW